MNKSKLSKFEGKPLIPEVLPEVNFLGGDFGTEVLEEYRQRAEKDYRSRMLEDVFLHSFPDEAVEGSNPYPAVLIN